MYVCVYTAEGTEVLLLYNYDADIPSTGPPERSPLGLLFARLSVSLCVQCAAPCTMADPDQTQSAGIHIFSIIVEHAHLVHPLSARFLSATCQAHSRARGPLVFSRRGESERGARTAPLLLQPVPLTALWTAVALRA